MKMLLVPKPACLRVSSSDEGVGLLVVDHDDEIIEEFSQDLTPLEARELAHHLIEAADRCDALARGENPPPPVHSDRRKVGKA